MHRSNVKRKAYAFTLLATFWTFFSIFAMYDVIGSHLHLGARESLPHRLIWGMHILLISCAIYFAKYERPKPALCISLVWPKWLQILLHGVKWAHLIICWLYQYWG